MYISAEGLRHAEQLHEILDVDLATHEIGDHEPSKREKREGLHVYLDPNFPDDLVISWPSTLASGNSSYLVSLVITREEIARLAGLLPTKKPPSKRSRK